MIKDPDEMAIIVGSADAGAAGLGGKAGALARLTAAGFPVPAWFAVTPRAFEASLTAEQREAVASAADPGRLRRALADVRAAPVVEEELRRAVRDLGNEDDAFAVRSSAREEDSSENSFAGQLESYLFVPARDVPSRVADVWRSAFSGRVLAYRRERGLSGSPEAPAVIVQRMVDADVSGVAFSANPVNGDRHVAVVGSLYGLGTALVSGDAEADTHHVDREGRIVERRVAAKTTAHRRAERAGGIGVAAMEVDAERAGDIGVAAVEVDAERAALPALRDEEAAAVADLARRVERFFACPQDVEWAIAGGVLHLLQARPITTLPVVSAARGALAIWDNSNIAESYGGVTTPLTFTFARNAYEGVYGQLCRIFGVPARRVEDNRDALAHMLGLIRGRIYYNLLNWYRLLAMLPGYRMNRAFLESMIGVRERAPEGVLGDDAAAPWHARVIDGMYFVRMVTGVIAAYFLLPARMRRFYRRVDEAVDTGDLSALSADELAAEYRRLESRLITRWDAPQVNDFFAMIFFGWLRRLCRTWCGDKDGTLQNGLLSGAGGMVSTEPADRVAEMAAMAREIPELADALQTADSPRVAEIMSRYPEFLARYDEYLRKFGERCADELKLESPTLHENPLMLMRSIGFLAERPGGDAGHSARNRLREDSERRARAALGPDPARRAVFACVLANARRFVRGRENMRLQRTRVFARVRAIFVELGRRLHALGLLDDPRDVFYLEMEELLGFVFGAAVSSDLKGLVTLRREEFARYARMEPPPDRFETRGVVYAENAFRAAGATDDAGGERRTGTGCCPGRVSGRVRVVLDPKAATLRHGDILVAERTDPSWVMLFPFARGLLVERGSLLSHSAIVAREMGIPAIVSIAGLTRWLKDGDWVELDGTTGVVSRTAPPAGAP